MGGEKTCIHCYVSGKVQDVWYRANTEKQAKALGLTGWVKNLPDGRVELVACGDSEALAKLREWLWEGPEEANVTDVDCLDEPWEEHGEFHIIIEE